MNHRTSMKASFPALLVVALAGAACGGSSPTAPPTTSGSTEHFTGLLPVQGSSFYSFTVTAAETVTISLASLTAGSVGAASPSVVRLGLGVPLGTDCSVNNSVDTAAGLTSQLTASINPDTYCVRISDIGNLTAPMNFTILIGQNFTITSPPMAPATETFSSFLSIGGTSTHSFTVTQAGTISVTLTSVTPLSMVGLGIGISGTATPCALSSSLNATAGSTPQLTIAVDAGTYCAQVYDPGTLTNPGVSFSMTIMHP
jgi:hypothetical protein